MAFTSADVVAAVSGLVRGSQAEIGYAFEAPGGSWRVRRVELCEGVSAPYRCVLELLAVGGRANLTALEGSSAVLRVERDPCSRRLCGIVQRVEHMGPVSEDLLVRVHLVPALALLAHTRDSRIFQEQPIPDILRAVLSAGLAPFGRTVRLSLDRTYQPREYCTQYGESDLDFALRLMAEEGIFFFFDQAGEKEELVLVDGHQGRCPEHPSCDGNPVPVVSPAREIIGVEVIHRFELTREVRATGVVLRDFDWTRPALDLTHARAGEAGEPALSVYDYPEPQVIAGYDRGGKNYTREEGQEHARLRKEELDSRRRTAAGESDATALSAGQLLQVTCDDRPELGGKYLVTEVEHRGEAPDLTGLEPSAAVSRKERYQNRFTCVPAEVAYRPPLRARPVVPGPQTALVVGPAGDEIHTDEHGRIRVQFHWDRVGTRDEKSSCWIRTAQAWSGAGWGFQFLPRVGMEVVVQFLEGNPDRPLVTGCVYDGARRPPYDLPGNSTQSGIKTSSSPGGRGSNELRFEDAAGKEEVYLHAQKNLTELVENDHATTVHANQTNAVDKNRTKTVGGDETNTVKGSRTTTVTGDETVTAQANRTETVSGGETVSVQGQRSHSVGGDEALSVSGGRTKSVTGKETAMLSGGRQSTVTGDDELQVSQARRVVADVQHQVVQGPTSFTFEGGHVDLMAGGHVRLVHGASEVLIDEAGNIAVASPTLIELICGGSGIRITPTKVEILGESEVALAGGAGSTKLDGAGVAVSGPKLSSVASALHEIAGAVVKLN